MDALYILEQANDLGRGLRHWVAQLPSNGSNLGANFRPDVAFDEIVDLIQSHQGSQLFVGQVDGRIDKQLLGKLDDGAVSTPDVLTQSALRTQTRYDLNDEVYLIWQERIEVNEAISRELGKLNLR